MILTRDYFDHAQCSVPGCPGDHDHPHDLYLHQGCHVKEGIIPVLEHGTLTLRCAVCFRRVVGVKVTDQETAHQEYHNTCHKTRPLWVYYKDGILQILCAKCEKEIARLEVAK